MKRKSSVFITFIAGAVVILLIVAFVAPSFLTKDTPPQMPAGKHSVDAPSQMRTDGWLTFLGNGGTEIVRISIEIADSDQERTQGLMGRTRIGEKEGMLFIFEDEFERSFWMANTPLPLDILFVNSSKEIVKIHRHTQPYSEESLPSNSPAQYVVEVNAGFTDKYGIAEGQSVSWTGTR